MKKLILLLILSTLASGDIESYLNNQYIPVEKISFQDSVVVASYNMDLMIGSSEFNQDIAYIFGALAREYPNSESIIIVCYAEEEPLYDYSVSTSAVRLYAEGQISDEEFLSSVTLEEHKKDLLSKDMIWIAGGAGLLMFLVLLFFAAFFMAYLFFRKKR